MIQYNISKICDTGCHQDATVYIVTFHFHHAIKYLKNSYLHLNKKYQRKVRSFKLARRYWFGDSYHQLVVNRFFYVADSSHRAQMGLMAISG